MSVKAITWAYEKKVGSGALKAILVKLADNANDEGLCWPSLKRIAETTEYSISYVKKAIKELEKKGFLTIIRQKIDGTNIANRYQLKLPEIASQGRVGHQVAWGRSPQDRSLHYEPSKEPSYKRADPKKQESATRKTKYDKRTGTLVDYYQRKLKSELGENAILPNGVARGIFNGILQKSVDPLVIMQAIDKWFVRADKWHIDRGYMIEDFKKMFNSLVASEKKSTLPDISQI